MQKFDLTTFNRELRKAMRLVHPKRVLGRDELAELIDYALFRLSRVELSYAERLSLKSDPTTLTFEEIVEGFQEILQICLTDGVFSEDLNAERKEQLRLQGYSFGEEAGEQ